MDSDDNDAFVDATFGSHQLSCQGYNSCRKLSEAYMSALYLLRTPTAKVRKLSIVWLKIAFSRPSHTTHMRVLDPLDSPLDPPP